MGDTSALEPGTIIAGRYRVASKIGHGGMGAVYQVHHVHTDEALALKVLHPEVLRDASVVERFRREAKAPARITSEHIARVTDADVAPDLDGAPFYVMELLRGRDLERILTEEGPLPAPKVVEYLRQMARALDKAHALGIIHRDLKPENLFLTEREDGSPCIKLLDFGIARLGDVEGPAPLSTQVGYVFGTPNYMAPEQATGDVEKIGPTTDVWAIGLLAFKLLVGQEFFTGKTSAHLYAQILSEPLATPTARGATAGPAFDAWFARCVARNPEERFPSAGQAIVELGASLDAPLRNHYPSSASFPEITASASSPGIVMPMPQPVSASAALAPPAAVTAGPTTALPTTLPAGVPARSSTRIWMIGGAVVLLGCVGFFGVSALRNASSTTTSSHGLIAASASASASSASDPLSLAPSASSTSTDPPPPPTPSSSTTLILPAAPTTTEARPRATAAAPKPTAPPKDDHVTLSREQKKRLDALDRLCNQGTYTPAECQSKRQAIIHGG